MKKVNRFGVHVGHALYRIRFLQEIIKSNYLKYRRALQGIIKSNYLKYRRALQGIIKSNKIDRLV